MKFEEWNTPYLKLDLIKKEIQFTANQKSYIKD